MGWIRFKHVERRLSGGRFLFTTASDSIRMGRIRRKDTAPEIAVRRAASNLRLRYRLDNRDLQGSPDLANRTGRWAIFVHGCFWHGHVGCAKYSIPRRNRAFWRTKLRANRNRDARVERELRGVGYRVVVIWECQAMSEQLVLKMLSKLLRSRRNGPRTIGRFPIRRIRRSAPVRIRRPT